MVAGAGRASVKLPSCSASLLARRELLRTPRLPGGRAPLALPQIAAHRAAARRVAGTVRMTWTRLPHGGGLGGGGTGPSAKFHICRLKIPSSFFSHGPTIIRIVMPALTPLCGAVDRRFGAVGARRSRLARSRLTRASRSACRLSGAIQRSSAASSMMRESVSTFSEAAHRRRKLSNRGMLRGGSNVGEKLPQMSRVLKYSG
jgi:hypothetical protein